MIGKLSGKYLLRHPVKTLILLFVVVLMAVSLSSAMMVRSATKSAANDIANGPGAGFQLTLSQTATSYSPRGLAKLKATDVEKISKIKGVASTYVRQLGAANVSGNLMSLNGGPITEKDDPKWSHTTSVDALNNSAGHTGFRTGLLTLAEGRHIKSDDKHTVLVHKDLAKLNGWKIGDKVTLSGHPDDPENVSRSTTSVPATIVGMFSGDNHNRTQNPFDLFSNIIISDLQTLWDLYGLTEANRTYSNASFTIDGSRPLDEVIAEGKELDLDWQNLELIPNTDYLYTAQGTIDSLSSTTTIVVGVTIVLALGVIVLILSLWQSARKREIGVLLSLGRTKRQILVQRFGEMIPIAALGTALAFLVSRALSGILSERALTAAKKVAEAKVQSVGQIGSDVETSQTTMGIGSLNVTLTPNIMFTTSALVLAIVAIAILATGLPSFRKSPRELIGSLS